MASPLDLRRPHLADRLEETKRRRRAAEGQATPPRMPSSTTSNFNEACEFSERLSAQGALAGWPRGLSIPWNGPAVESCNYLDALYFPRPEWRNWQTQGTQNLLVESSIRFLLSELRGILRAAVTKWRREYAQAESSASGWRQTYTARGVPGSGTVTSHARPDSRLPAEPPLSSSQSRRAPRPLLMSVVGRPHHRDCCRILPCDVERQRRLGRTHHPNCHPSHRARRPGLQGLAGDSGYQVVDRKQLTVGVLPLGSLSLFPLLKERHEPRVERLGVVPRLRPDVPREDHEGDRPAR